jgi:DNA-binding winged helix-turn-helix (wHTH) protein
MHMVENPFFHRGPIRDPAHFYNRQTEVKRVLEMLGKGQSVSITGSRKIGKTSLLFHLSRPEVLQRHGLDPARYVVVYFNCEGLGRLKLEEFYALILEEIAGRASQRGVQLVHPERPIPYLEFEGALRRVFDRNLRLALLLDEFELLGENRDLRKELLPGLRALVTKFSIAYLTVSRRQLAAFTEDDYSPFFNIFVPLKMRLFDAWESRELIEKSLAKAGATFPPAAIGRILELGGGHPFFLQVAGYWALELQATKGAPLESKDFRILAQTVRGQVESHFEYYWSHLTPRERYVLAALPLTQSEEAYREELDALACLCLIVREGGRYRYFSPLFRDFVRRQKVGGLLQAGPFVLSMAHRRALLHGNPLPLSARQFALLSYFMERQGQVVGNEELDREVISTSPEEQQEYEYLGDERLKAAIKGLRRALGDEADCIVNKRGVGYLLQIRAED